MGTTQSKQIEANRSLAHEVIVYAESCAYDALSGGQFHARWQSRYFEDHPRMSPAIAALLSQGDELRSDTVFLSLADREAVITLRILLADSGVSVEQLRAGFKEAHFPPFTAAVARFVRSSHRIVSSTPETWLNVAQTLIETDRPRLMIVEGLRFDCEVCRLANLPAAFDAIACAKAYRCALLLFD